MRLKELLIKYKTPLLIAIPVVVIMLLWSFGSSFSEDASDSAWDGVVARSFTSGTGSEATRHAVIYYKGEKQSICNSALLPEYVIVSTSLVMSTPKYQKMCTCLDALSQCMESSWSKKANKTSRKYAKEGIELFTIKKQRL